MRSEKLISGKPLSSAEARRRALLAAQWFVNTQVVHRKPCLDANHGRIFYNYYLPTRTGPRGLSWSHGRAIMCLLGAWELSGGKPPFLEAAVRCGTYLRQALQVMDARDPWAFGAFREEVPASRFCYPRDAIEAAFGLLLLHVATGERDYLERCEIFAHWYLTQAVDPAVNWPRGTVDFDDPARDPHALKFFQAGGAPFFWHLFQLTGKKRYLTAGLKILADGLIERFIDPASGAMLSVSPDAHHTVTQNSRFLAINDDGASLALTCAHAAFGRNGRSPYLDAAMRYADWLADACPRPLAMWAAPGMHAIALAEVAAVAGQRRYAEAAARLMRDHVRNQVLAPGKLDRHGAFRGEDEPAKWYVPGGRPRDFLTTRSTAYGALALLRLAGQTGPSYSALGLERFQRFCRKQGAGC
jgi:hypothetical protein